MGIRFPDRWAPWIIATVVGLLACKPLGGHAFSAAGGLTFIAGAFVGFIAGVPFYWRGKRRREKSIDGESRK
jgi:membrane associated rhomboid family serine protease